jgi:RNA polymerase sigma-70 factor, ECF subfamily
MQSHPFFGILETFRHFTRQIYTGISRARGMDDIAIVKRCVEGDAEAFRYIIERYKDKVAGVVYSIAGNRTDIEDLTQDVFIKAYNSLNSFRFDSAFNTWLYRIAANRAIDYVRRKKLVRFFSFDGFQNLFTGSENVGGNKVGSTSPDIESAEIKDLVQWALTKLDADYRIPLVLREFEELSYKEIGETLDLSVPAVKSRIFRAREEMRKILNPILKQEKK